MQHKFERRIMCTEKIRPGRDVECDEDVDGVVFVGGQDEEDAKHVADPREGVEEVEAATAEKEKSMFFLMIGHFYFRFIKRNHLIKIGQSGVKGNGMGFNFHVISHEFGGA